MVASRSPVLVLPIFAEAAEPAGAIEPADTAVLVNPPDFTDSLVTVNPLLRIDPPAPANIALKVREQPNGIPGKSMNYNLRETPGIAIPDYLNVMVGQVACPPYLI
ncbi:hypothetical protein FRC12_023037 [Ceratobasidium sp. 428]|nr:hypothetical protein FRC12_023037 [Ceratobasidium sp. 428]